jgi:hypothetical protein
MNKKPAIILIVVAFIIGVIGGGWSVAYIYGQITMRLITSTEAADTSMDVALLKQLRADDVSNATDLLEVQLDGSVGTLGLYMSNVPKAKRDPLLLKTLQTAKTYLEKFPYTNSSNPEIDQSVSNAFSLVSDQNGK